MTFKEGTYHIFLLALPFLVAMVEDEAGAGAETFKDALYLPNLL